MNEQFQKEYQLKPGTTIHFESKEMGLYRVILYNRYTHRGAIMDKTAFDGLFESRDL